MADTFRAMNLASKDRRRKNRENSTSMLIDRQIEFESKNHGRHLIITTNKGFVDFYPGTGLFSIRESKVKGRGIRHLLLHVLELNN